LCDKSDSEDGFKSEPKVVPVRLIFSYWLAEHHHPTAKIHVKRRKRIKARLAESYTPEDLGRAVYGVKYDLWLMGKNPSKKRYNADQIVRLRDLADDEDAMAVA
jgi:hypothetical protein